MRKTAAALIGLILLLTGCASSIPTGKPVVVVPNYPLVFLAQELFGDTAEIVSMAKPGVDPHDLELTAQDFDAMTKADVVLYQPGFQTAVDEAVQAVKPKLAVDVAKDVTIMRTTATGETPAPGADPEEEPSEYDPHIWLDPTNMEKMASATVSAIEAAQGDNAKALAETAKTKAPELAKKLQDLDSQFTAGLQGCERTAFVVGHEAFGYLAKRYGLTQIPVSGIDPSVEPTAARIAEVQAEITQYGITTAFYVAGEADTVTESIANDMHLSLEVLDAVELEPEGGYLAAMERNLTALQQADGCPIG
ncbi:MAG: metal ABC transporter substrate-binding protein [Propionibacteriaceae bacterium]|nr:metal ABC transporter substrate-binding protein [Propionibacteriaceae bacterium]